MSKKILVIGSSNIDIIIRIPYFHRPGETILGKDIVIAFGGKGANQAIASKRLGGAVIFLTKLGNDHYGRSYHAYLIKEGLPGRWIFRDEKSSTGIAFIELVKNGENRIIVSPGANNSLSREDLKLFSNFWKGIGVFLTQLEIPFETVKMGIEIAKESGVTTLLNPSPPLPLSRLLFPMVDFIVLNEEEAQILSGIFAKNYSDIPKVAKRLLNMGVKNVVITLGAKGLFFKNTEEEIWVKGFRVKSIDTTAAGDAFMGAFACALSDGKSIRDSLIFANGAGALAVTKLGAQPSLPSKRSLELFLQKENLKYRR